MIDAKEIAAKMTKAQRAFVIAWTHLGDVPGDDYPRNQDEVRTADWARSWGFFEPTSYRVTPLGLAVAEYVSTPVASEEEGARK